MKISTTLNKTRMLTKPRHIDKVLYFIFFAGCTFCLNAGMHTNHLKLFHFKLKIEDLK